MYKTISLVHKCIDITELQIQETSFDNKNKRTGQIKIGLAPLLKPYAVILVLAIYLMSSDPILDFFCI